MGQNTYVMYAGGRVGVRAYLCVRSLISHHNLVKCEPIIIQLYMDIAGLTNKIDFVMCNFLQNSR